MNIVFDSLSIEIGGVLYPSVSLQPIPRTEAFIDALEAFVTEHLEKETHLSRADPKLTLDLSIHGRWGTVSLDWSFPPTGFKGNILTLDEVPPEYQARIRNRCHAAAYFVAEATAMMLNALSEASGDKLSFVD